MSPDQKLPGGYDRATSEFELRYWEKFEGVAKFDENLPTYRKCFPLDDIDYGGETILDIGSGAVSVFERLAPEGAAVTPYDLLAKEFNRIAPQKKFMIRDHVDADSRFTLVTAFNMIDHVVRPEEVLDFAASRLAENGRVWLTVHLYQPYDKTGHPQNFSCSSIVELIARYFLIRRCGVVRDAVPQPYVWFGELAVSSKKQSGISRAVLKAKCGLTYDLLQSVRVYAKLMKIFGMRRFLPQAWQF